MFCYHMCAIYRYIHINNTVHSNYYRLIIISLCNNYYEYISMFVVLDRHFSSFCSSSWHIKYMYHVWKKNSCWVWYQNGSSSDHSNCQLKCNWVMMPNACKSKPINCCCLDFESPSPSLTLCTSIAITYSLNYFKIYISYVFSTIGVRIHWLALSLSLPLSIYIYLSKIWTSTLLHQQFASITLKLCQWGLSII